MINTRLPSRSLTLVRQSSRTAEVQLGPSRDFFSRRGWYGGKTGLDSPTRPSDPVRRSRLPEGLDLDRGKSRTNTFLVSVHPGGSRLDVAGPLVSRDPVTEGDSVPEYVYVDEGGWMGPRTPPRWYREMNATEVQQKGRQRWYTSVFRSITQVFSF